MVTENLVFDNRDEFNRRPIAEKIIKLLQANIDISPMVIDGNWGTGKTEFCYKLINLFKEEGTYNLIYIDAFKADHIDDPLLSIISEIIKIDKDENKQKEIIKKIAPTIGYGAKVLGKAVVSHLLKQDTDSIIEGYDETIQKIADKAIDAGVGVMLKEYVKAEKNLKALQDVLKEITQDKPIVIFIDELDRCRPDFAIKMLEVIKHTFDIEDLQFVLITNMEQLKASVNHCYGSGVNAQNYLEKFLKFRIELPVKMQRNLVSLKYFNNLAKQSKVLENIYSKNMSIDYYSLVKTCIEVSKLSLRDIENLVRHFEIYQIITNKISSYKEMYSDVQLLAICLYVINPSSANQFLLGNSDANDIAILLGIDKIPVLKELDRPRIEEFYCVLLGSECKLNSDQYSNYLKTKVWQDYLLSMNGGFRFDTGDRRELMEVFIQTLSDLSLNTAMVSLR